MKLFFCLLFSFFTFLPLVQAISPSNGGPALSDSIKPERFWGASIGKGLFTGLSYWGLDHAWYRHYPRGSFHFFDDKEQWKQMDKAGHLWGGFHSSRWSSSIWEWTGMREEQAALWGAGTGFLMLSGIEVMDGFSKEWGASWSDAASNLLGASAFYIQERNWGKPYIFPVFSYRPSSLASYRPELLGEGSLERVLKDYNGQRYWLNFDMELFGDDHPFPDWVALSIGYGADGMLGGKRNPGTNAAGRSLPDMTRHRRYFLSIDLVLRDLPVEGKGWRTLFSILDCIKLPFPALEYNRVDGFKGHWAGP